MASAATGATFAPTSDLLAGEAVPLRNLTVSVDTPSLHFEVVSDPYVDAPDGGDSPAALAEAVVRRYRRLREPFQERPCHLVVVRGPRTVAPEPPGLDRDAMWTSAFAGLADPETPVIDVSPHDRRGDLALAYAVRADPGDGTGSVLIGVVALIGVPRSDDDDAGRGAERLVRALAAGPALHAPLHVVVVTGDARPGSEFLTRCERLRASLVVAAAAERDDVVTVSRTHVRPGHAAAEVAILPCPSLKPGSGRPGLTHVRLDLLKGEASVAFRYDLGSDRPPRPVQVLRPLVSASRVTSSEQRLHRRITELLAGDPDGASSFAGKLRGMWEEHGYARLGDDKGTVPLPVARHDDYNLLLLLRKRGKRYEILLSNHSPLRPSPLSDWNTLLLPAFKSARALLEHLRDDVLRQAAERAEDFERAERARHFEKAVQRIVAKPDDHLWDDELRDVQAKTIRKVSPTSGAVTEYSYRLVTLLPLVDRGAAREGGPDEHNDRHRIIDWLDGLEAVRCPGEEDGPGIPAEALMAEGGGLRWDPASGLSEPAGALGRRRLARAYPGAIWFPLVDHAGEPLWRSCPSIVARNSDVMTWVTKVVSDLVKGDRPMPDELLLGGYRGRSDRYEVEHRFPFEGPGERAKEVPGTSTVEALGLVEFIKDFDLGGKAAYEGAEFQRVWLRREVVNPGHTWPREAIAVYAGEAGDPAAPELGEPRRLGYLRPVQRYVLKPGLERVRRLTEDLLAQSDEDADRWGFVRVRKGGAPAAVSVTPPIIEELHPIDRDPTSGPGDRDFIVCDGNHRIVHGAWRSPGPLPAVAVIGDLAEPYYAHPYGRFEWDAAIEVPVSPPNAFKYLRRKVDAARHPPPAGWTEDDLYRRYYRDLEKGFGPMGGQGGRFV